MKRKDLMERLARTLIRRRAALQKTLAGNTSMIAANDAWVGDSADVALDSEQDTVDSQLAAVESRELAAIDAALDRIRNGGYGICESCEQPIPTARLQALPYATLCIKCQREEERFGTGPSEAAHWERVTDDTLEDEPNHSKKIKFQLV